MYNKIEAVDLQQHLPSKANTNWATSDLFLDISELVPKIWKTINLSKYTTCTSIISLFKKHMLWYTKYCKIYIVIIVLIIFFLIENILNTIVNN